MKINTIKRTPAQLRKREADLLSELCAYHGYSFSRSIRPTMLFSKIGKRTKLEAGVVLELMVPASGALGRQLAEYEKKNPKPGRKSKTRPLSKIGPGPSRP